MRKWRSCTFKYSVRSFGLHVDFAGCTQCGVHPAEKAELGAHQMAPGGVISHWRSRRALLLVSRGELGFASPVRIPRIS